MERLSVGDRAFITWARNEVDLARREMRQEKRRRRRVEEQLALMEESFKAQRGVGVPAISRQPDSTRVPAASVDRPAETPCRCITEHHRAPRVMRNAQDFRDNEAEFRCGSCRRLLDAPLAAQA